MTDQFTVHVVTGDGEHFDGIFKIRLKLSFRQQLRRDERRRQLLGEVPPGTTPNDRARDLSEMFSELDVRVLDAPKWWTSSDGGIDLEDDDIAVEVYTKAMKCVADKAGVTKNAGKDAQGDLAKAAPRE